MLDLDQYMNNSVKIKLFGKEYDVFEPTVGMILEMDQLEADLSEDNVYEKRIDACLLLINHNRQGREFTADEIKKLPLEAVIRLIAEVSALRLKADTDPNSESQFRKEKSEKQLLRQESMRLDISKSEKQSAKSISRQRTGKEHTA